MTDLAPNLRADARAPRDVRAVRVSHGAARGSVLVGLAAAVVTALLLALTPLYIELTLSLGVLVGTLAWVLDGWAVASRTVRIEGQLADALDLLGSSVAAGVGLVEALDGVVRDVRPPLRAVLAAAAERLRLGDDPQRVFEDAERTLPLPAFRLLTHYLTAQWQSGGALAPGLHAIADTVRDRVNLSRRVHGQTAEARVSVIGILLIVYGISAFAWIKDPDRIEAFLESRVGGGLAATAVLAQAAGIVWMARLTRIEL
ncbi:MAG: type II secretion system F family protein [Planctomycetota bacterium]